MSGSRVRLRITSLRQICVASESEAPRENDSAWPCCGASCARACRCSFLVIPTPTESSGAFADLPRSIGPAALRCGLCV